MSTTPSRRSCSRRWRPRPRARCSISAATAPVSLDELAGLLVAANGGGDFAKHEFPAERRRIDIGDYYADDSLFRRATGWRPAVTLAEGLRRSLAYFRENCAHYV